MKDYLSKPEINFFLSILIPLIALAVAWGAMDARLTHVEAMAIGLQSQYKSQTETNEQIKVSLARIETDIIYIRQGLDKHLSN